MSQHFAIVCNIDAHTVLCITHVTLLDLYYFSFDLLVHYRGDKRTIFQGAYIYYLHAQ